IATLKLVRGPELYALPLNLVAARIHPTLAVVADVELRVARLLFSQRDAVEEVLLALWIVAIDGQVTQRLATEDNVLIAHNKDVVRRPCAARRGAGRIRFAVGRIEELPFTHPLPAHPAIEHVLRRTLVGGKPAARITDQQNQPCQHSHEIVPLHRLSS